MATARHWTEEIFIQSPLLFMPDMIGRLEKAEEEAGHLIKFFIEHGVPGDGLDVACGIGGHSTALTNQGYRCIGIDISSEYVAKAREIATTKEVDENCRFVASEMRRLKDKLGGYRFDTAICMYMSLGYYDTETDIDVLNQLKKLFERVCWSSR